ncbi:hypothetical protein L6274_03095 [Candidatus Parcubacteria bacterium]|nr:hypothetical protein [Candidatus Parcubacteria bacterium]
MSYIELLLELIKSKKEMSGDNIVSLSIGEIADAWGRNVLYEDQFSISKSKHIDYDFLQDVVSALKNLEDKKLIAFMYTVRGYPYYSLVEKKNEKEDLISDIVHLFSLNDKIYLEVEEKLLYESKPNNKKGEKNCIVIPADTKNWNDIEIKFKNEFDIEIFVKGKFHKKTNNEDLNFYSGRKNKKPDRQWQFLILLSILQGKRERNATKDEIVFSLSNKFGKKI